MILGLGMKLFQNELLSSKRGSREPNLSNMDVMTDMKRRVDAIVTKPPSMWSEEDKKLVSMIRSLKQ